MTIADKIARLQTARTNIGNAITAKGGTVAAGDGFEDFSADIATIPTGGGEAIDDMADIVFWDMTGEPTDTMTLAEMQAATSLPIPTGAQNTNTAIPIEHYGQLQYLIGASNTNIETALDYYPNQDTKIEYCAKVESISGGSSTGINSYQYRNLYTIASNGKWRVKWGSQQVDTIAYDIATMEDSDFNTFVISKDGIFVNGAQYGAASAVEFTDTNRMRVGFTPAGKNYTKHIKIWDSGVLVHHLVPVVKWETAAMGFLDLVDDTFYASETNAKYESTTPPMYDMPTARTFVPSITEKVTQTRAITRTGYTWMEWLESSGTQYIDMGLKGTQFTTVSCIGMNTSAEGAVGQCQLFGDNTTNTKAITCQTERVSTAVTRFGAQSKTMNVSFEEMAKYVTSQNGLKWGDNFEQWASTVANFTTDGNLWLFGANGGTPIYSTCRISECEVWDSGRKQRHFVAAKRDSDNALGMYDLVNDEFYANDGTGTFASGNTTTRTEEYTAEVTKTWAGVPFFFEGWSWSLAQLKDNGLKMDVGSYWEPTDHKTHICVDIPECDKTFELFRYATPQMNGYVTIDWGDGSQTIQDGVTGNSVVSDVHTYANAGQHTIKVWSAYPFSTNPAYHARLGTVTPNKGLAGNFRADTEKVKFVFFSGYMANWSQYSIGGLADVRLVGLSRFTRMNSTSMYNNGDCFALEYLLLPFSTYDSGNNAYMNARAIKRICFPPSHLGGFGGAGGGSTASFTVNYELKRLCIPKDAQVITTGTGGQASFGIPGLRYIAGGNFQWTSTAPFTWYNNCEELEEVRWPVGVTKLGQNFAKCYKLREIEIPDTVFRIESYAFGNGYGNYLTCQVMSLEKIVIPKSVQAIANRAFYSCVHIGEIHFLNPVPPTAESANTFQYLDTNTKLYVPAGSLAAYTSATNYPSSATYTYIEE